MQKNLLPVLFCCFLASGCQHHSSKTYHFNPSKQNKQTYVKKDTKINSIDTLIYKHAAENEGDLDPKKIEILSENEIIQHFQKVIQASLHGIKCPFISVEDTKKLLFNIKLIQKVLIFTLFETNGIKEKEYSGYLTYFSAEAIKKNQALTEGKTTCCSTPKIEKMKSLGIAANMVLAETASLMVSSEEIHKTVKGNAEALKKYTTDLNYTSAP